MTRTQAVGRDILLLVAAEAVAVAVVTLVSRVQSWDPDLVGAARAFIGTLILDLFWTPVMALPAAAVIVTARSVARVYRSVVLGRLAGVCVAFIATIVLSARPEDWPDGGHVLRFATFLLTTLVSFLLLAPISRDGGHASQRQRALGAKESDVASEHQPDPAGRQK